MLDRRVAGMECLAWVCVKFVSGAAHEFLVQLAHSVVVDVRVLEGHAVDNALTVRLALHL